MWGESNEWVYAIRNICAKATEVINLNHKRSTYAIVSNSVQTACIIECDKDIIEIRSFYKIVNTLGFTVDAIISAANIPHSFTIKDT